VQNDQTAEEIRSDKRADVEGQYRELKQLRKQLATEQDAWEKLTAAVAQVLRAV